MTVQDILRRSKALIEQGWTKYRSEKKCNGNVCYCTTGAVNKVVRSSRHEYTFQRQLGARAFETLGEVIRPVRNTWGSRIIAIQNWNDAEQRRKHDVLKAFDRAIARAESLNA